MTRYATVLSLILAMLLVTGCGKDEKEGASVPDEKQAEKTDEDAVKEAKALLEKIQQYLKDGKLDQAETELKKLEGMDKLPKDMQDKIKVARTSLTAAQSARKVNIPKLPGT